jgi:hypothetical protein
MANNPAPSNEYEMVVRGPKLERTFSKFALKGQPLSGYRTGDSFYYKEFKEVKVKVNSRALVAVIITAFLLSCLIVAVLYGANTTTFVGTVTTYNHSMVNLLLPVGPTCSFSRNCTKTCDTIYLEHLTGCCWGCGIADTCSFPVIVNWTNVPEFAYRVRIFLFVTLDGTNFFQSGNGPIVVNSTGSAIVGDGCFGEIGHPMILVACLTSNDETDASYVGFPASHCISSFGICAVSGGAFIKSLSYCLPDNEWTGNTYINSWPGPLYGAGSSLLPYMWTSFLSIIVAYMIQ